MKKKRQHDLPQPNSIMHEQSINFTRIIKVRNSYRWLLCVLVRGISSFTINESHLKIYIYIAFKQAKTMRRNCHKEYHLGCYSILLEVQRTFNLQNPPSEIKLTRAGFQQSNTKIWCKLILTVTSLLAVSTFIDGKGNFSYRHRVQILYNCEECEGQCT